VIYSCLQNWVEPEIYV